VARALHTVGGRAGGDRPAGGEHDEAGHPLIMPDLGAPRRLRDDEGVSDETPASEDVEAPAPGDSEASPPPDPPPSRRRLKLLLWVAAVVLILDVVTKVAAVHYLDPTRSMPIIGDTVTWTLVRNSGAAFSMATGYTWVLTLVAMAVVIGIFWMGRRLVSPWWALGLGMILGGALGNLVDRFFRAPGPLRGHVVDFLSIGWWPVFNVADSAVVGGAVLLVVLSVFGVDYDSTGRPPAEGSGA
jgi:signal peptidase II